MSGNVVYLKKFASDNLNELLSAFEKHLLETDRARSAKIYLGDIKRFCEWFAGQFSSSVLSAAPLDIADYRRHLQEEGKKPATINRSLVSLRVFYGWLKKQNLVPDNPAEDIRPVAENSLAPKWLTRSQQAALIRALREEDNPRDEAVISLMLHAGLRVGEVVNLKREDIKIGERSGSVTVRSGKGNKRREVPLNRTARKMIARWLEKNPDGPLFPNRYGKPISARGIFDIVAEYAYRAKLENVTPHTLRHTFCKNAIDAGIPLDQVAAMAGHSRLDVTRRYTAPSLQDLQSAVERMGWE